MWRVKIFLMILVVLLSSLVAAQSKKTVSDYWKTHANKKDVLLETLKTDLKNDYIAYDGRWEGGGEFAVWRRKNGSDLIGQTNYGCGPACLTSSVVFLEANKTDVTKKVLPSISASQEKQMTVLYNKKSGETASDISYYLKFPRNGTTIEVRSGEHGDDDMVLAQYKFNGSSFVFEMAK
jgi:hypothetical protein